MRVAALLFVIGTIVQGIAHDWLLFLPARLCSRMAVGAASVLSPAYISEIAPASIRGRMTTVQQIMIITGLTAAFVVNYFSSRLQETTQLTSSGLIQGAWRWICVRPAIPAVIFYRPFFIPEVPAAVWF